VSPFEAIFAAIARSLRLEFAGGAYRFMSRGGAGKGIFRRVGKRRAFLREAAAATGTDHHCRLGFQGGMRERSEGTSATRSKRTSDWTS
jgi:hypothetical protein